MPQPTTPAIQTGNALSAYLAFACVLNHTVAANKAVDLVSGTLGTLGVDASWVTGPNGSAVRCLPDSHDGAVNFGVMRPLATGASYSAFVVCKPNNIGNYRALFGARNAYSGMDWSIGLAPDGTIMVGIAGSALTATGATLVNGAWVSVGVTVKAAQALVYLNGTLAGTITADLRPLAPVIPNNVRIGGIDPSDAAESFGGDVDCAYLWAGRELTAGDYVTLTASPYAFLSPPLTTKYLAFLASDGVRAFSITN
jgi:hypothetical protein